MSLGRFCSTKRFFPSIFSHTKTLYADDKTMAKKKFAFAWSPLRRLMKESGAEIVSKEAVETLLFYLEDRSQKLTKMALKFAKHSKRKKITTGDMELAVDYL